MEVTEIDLSGPRENIVPEEEEEPVQETRGGVGGKSVTRAARLLKVITIIHPSTTASEKLVLVALEPIKLQN